MDYSALVGLSCFIGMFALVILGVPIFVSMLVGAIVGFWLIGGAGLAFQQFGSAPYFVSASYMLAVIPLFVLMGTIAGETGIAKSSYDAVSKWVGGLRGGDLNSYNNSRSPFRRLLRARCSGSSSIYQPRFA